MGIANSKDGDGKSRSSDTKDRVYNGLGQRVQKFGSSVLTRHYLYNSDGSLVGEYTDTGAPVLELVKLGDLPVAVLTPAGTLYAQADHLGTVRALQNATGVTVWQWNSDPFGAVQPEQDPDGDGVATAFPLRFPGQYYDAETGTHYNYHRDYDPQLGRYAQVDPLGVAGGLNVYAYVGNDPARMVDPTGEFGLLGVGVGISMEIAMQLSTNGYNWSEIDLTDVVVAGAFGFVAPGAISSGKSILASSKALSSLARQSKTARTTNRSAKIRQRINRNIDNVFIEVSNQTAFQWLKASMKETFNRSSIGEELCTESN